MSVLLKNALDKAVKLIVLLNLNPWGHVSIFCVKNPHGRGQMPWRRALLQPCKSGKVLLFLQNTIFTCKNHGLTICGYSDTGIWKILRRKWMKGLSRQGKLAAFVINVQIWDFKEKLRIGKMYICHFETVSFPIQKDFYNKISSDSNECHFFDNSGNPYFPND